MLGVEEIEAFCPKVEGVAPKRRGLAEQCDGNNIYYVLLYLYLYICAYVSTLAYTLRKFQASNSVASSISPLASSRE